MDFPSEATVTRYFRGHTEILLPFVELTSVVFKLIFANETMEDVIHWEIARPGTPRAELVNYLMGGSNMKVGGGSDKIIPTKITHPNLSELAWLGDAQLLADLRYTCVANTGVIDHDWVVQHSTGNFMALDMAEQGYQIPSSLNAHSIGQAFECLYYCDPVFRQSFMVRHKVRAFSTNVIVGEKIASRQQERCWVKLFADEPVSHEFWVRDQFLSKGQLQQLARTNVLSSGRFSLIKESLHSWHLVAGGDLSATQVLDSMFNKTRLGGFSPNELRKRFPVHTRSQSALLSTLSSMWEEVIDEVPTAFPGKRLSPFDRAGKIKTPPPHRVLPHRRCLSESAKKDRTIRREHAIARLQYVGDPMELVPALEVWLQAFGKDVTESHVFWLLTTCFRCTHGKLLMPNGFPIMFDVQCKECVSDNTMAESLRDLGLSELRPDQPEPPLGGMADCWKTFLWLKPDDVTGPISISKAISMFSDFLENTAVQCSSSNCSVYAREERAMHQENARLARNMEFMKRQGHSDSSIAQMFEGYVQEDNVRARKGMRDCKKHIPPAFIAERKMLLTKVTGGYHLEVCPRRKAFLGKTAEEILDSLKVLEEEWKSSQVFEKMSNPVPGTIPLSDSGCVVDWPEDLDDWLLGLTTAVVMGTIGDVEPTLDVVAANWFAAQMEKTDPTPLGEQYEFTEAEGHGWMATDFQELYPPFAKSLSDKSGTKKGNLKVSKLLWNEICAAWVGEVFELQRIPGEFPLAEDCDEDLSSVSIVVPERDPSPHHRVMPDDFVLLTHPDHIQRFAEESWETRALPIGSHEFIKLGQDILEKGLWALQDMKAMHETLFQCVKACHPVMEQSDLVYLVSGTTFHYFMASLFPEKQVFEVCPVPREDNGVCPEFYLGHYFKDFSPDPHFGFQVGRLYNKWLTAPKYLSELDWEGTYKYVEPPKFHSIMPWAARKWNISGPNIGFKPFDDFIVKTSFTEKEHIKGYFSLGSCESITPETERALVWLKGLPVEWDVDIRWVKYFENTPHRVAPFFSHALGLHQYDWVVHHGGSGVTNTCLACKIPQTIIPQIGDQFVWSEALINKCIPLYTSVIDIRAMLFLDRLEPKEVAIPSPPLRARSWWVDAVVENGGSFVEPFAFYNHCCHDQDTYGWKPRDLVVAHNEHYWFTLFVSNWENPEKPQEYVLKFVRKKCTPSGPPLWGKSGWVGTMTYPEHAHGWLLTKAKAKHYRKVVSARHLDKTPDDVLLEVGSMAMTSRSKNNPYFKKPPQHIGKCPNCGKDGYDAGGLCEWCTVSPLCNVFDLGTAKEILDKLYGDHKPLKKGVPMHVSFSMGPVGFATRSRKRYFVLDSRALDKAPNRMVARALMDQISSLDDTLHVEAFWSYTKTQPPHYNFKNWDFKIQNAIDAQVKQHLDVQISGLVEEVIKALGAVLSVSSVGSLARRVIGRNVLTRKGRSFMFQRWHVFVDAMRHYDDLCRQANMSVMPELVRGYFEPLPEAKCKVLIPWGLGLAKQIRSRVGSTLWMDIMRGSGAPIKIHLFSLRLPVLGTRFGVFHAIIEHDGWFWELQQVSGELCHINRTKWQPEATPDRPWCKTILVDASITGSLDLRKIQREFEGINYKILGDNCLVFANLLVYLLTGTVVPWEHFGVFGEKLELEVWSNVSKWACSYFFLKENEHRVRLQDKKSDFVQWWQSGSAARQVSWAGPKKYTRDYGLEAVQRIEAILQDYEPGGLDNCPMERDHMLDFIELGMRKFSLTGFVVARAIMTRRVRNIPTSRKKFRFLEKLLVVMRQFKDVKLVQDLKEVATQMPTIRHALRRGKKVSWTPLVNISVPRHWFRSGSTLVEISHQPENVTMQPKKRVVLDLPQIAARYKHYFPGVEFPPVGFKYVKPGEYEIGVKVPLRKDLPKMDALTRDLISDLQDLHPFELGVFSLRFGTLEMAEKVTDRYFTGSFEPGQLISEEEQEEIAQAIFENESRLYEDAQLLNPEEVWKKWHRNYSAGFPYRFNSKGNASRQRLIDECGGKEKFLEGVRRYIESPEAFPTVSHAFIKDEVLPSSYIEREKIRTIIAQDPLNYYLAACVQGDQAKRLDPGSFSAVGVSVAHGELAALAEKHLAYKHHYAMDVTALDSTAAVDCVGVIKKLRKKGFQNHKQREAIETAIDATYDNLVTSWIIDIHTGRARLKKQGLSTGHFSTTPSNTEYMRVLMLKAWKDITGRPIKDFYETTIFSSYSDDNFWGTDLSPSVFSAEKVSEYWLERGVQVRVEGQSDNLGDLSFLSEQFSQKQEHLDEIAEITGMHPRVAIVHDANRLLQKFSDYKKRNTLRYRWEKFVALQLNCAHHRDIFDAVDKYLDVLEKELLKRHHNRKFIQQHPRTTYEKVMRMRYVPTDRTKQNLVIHRGTETIVQKLENWWDTLRADIMTFDSDMNTYARILQQFTGLLEIGGLNIEDPALFLKGPGQLKHDDEFTLEHHLYLLNGCPESFEKMQMLAGKSPFSAFMDIEGFWPRREIYDLSEEMANGLRCKVMLLMGIYTLVAWLEQALQTVPVIGPVYRVFCTAKYMSEKVYSRLNSLYYAMFGDSSLIISSLMPKDRYFSLKVVAHNLWCALTPTDLFNHGGDIGQLQDLLDAMVKVGQDVHNLVFEMDISVLLPVAGSGERDKPPSQRQWLGLDHNDSVQVCKDLLQEGKTPLITAETAAGKSTDFIVSLMDNYETVIVSCPRTILVEKNPVASKRLYAGCSDSLTPGVINFGTAGYLRRMLGDLPEGTILVLDEFHEMDEDTLYLYHRYHGNCITVSATPDFPGSDALTNVHLTKSRAAGFKTEEVIRDGNGTREEAWSELLESSAVDNQDKVLVILPTVKMVTTFVEHAVRMVPNKRICALHAHSREVTDADWYFATSIVDAGLTIPGLTKVIDTGWSLGYHEGQFIKRPSSHNVSEQRRGRTGRTCNGFYVRLQTRYDDAPWDFSTAFLCNHWEVAAQWLPTYRRGLCKEKGVIESLPGGYREFMANSNWSALIYLTFLYENRLDVNKARAQYQACRKFPEHKEFKHLMGPIENRALSDLHVVEANIRDFRLRGQEGNVWTWDLQNVRLLSFCEPVPKHLREKEL